MASFLHLKRIGLVLAVLWTGLAHAQWHVNILWQRQGLQDSSGYGALILPLGDQNDDGYADWAVFAAAPYSPGEADSSYLEFFHGGNPPSTTPYFTYTPAMTNNGYFGGAWAIGDVNGDGYQDWMVRVAYLNPYGYFEVQIFYGGPDQHTVPDARWHFHWETDDEQFHWIGDFNGDGFADLYKWRRTGDVGFACFGSAAFDTIPDWSRTSPPDSAYQSYPDTYGDLNGDHFADFVSGTNQPEPRIYVFWGGTPPDTVPGQVIVGIHNNANSIVNDLNRDGRDELIVLSTEGVFLFWGSAILHTQPDVTLAYPCPYPPDRAVSLGDINGDEYQDFAIITNLCTANSGLVSVFLGNYDLSSNPVWTLTDRGGPPYLVGITDVAGLGDINGDGINDIAIGATNEDNDGIRGRAVILSGDTTTRVEADPPRSLLADRFEVNVYPNPFNASATISYVVPKAGVVKVELFDLTGRLVQTLLQEQQEAGEHAVVVDGKGLASGVYFVCARIGTVARVVKVMLLK